jgi:hypothetical protein
MGDYAGAVEDFTTAISLDPGNADFYHNRGFSLRKQVGNKVPLLALIGGPAVGAAVPSRLLTKSA